jgi:hypothetical protein
LKLEDLDAGCSTSTGLQAIDESCFAAQAPYLRIPLVLQFFGDHARMHLLDDASLQDVLDSCLFEPGLWQAEHDKQPLTHIPPATREHTATPCGLLANELVHAPGPLLSTLNAMLVRALDLDTGVFGTPAANIILYMVRLVTRVAEYAAFVVQNSKHKQKVTRGAASTSGGGWTSYVRGLGKDPGSPGFDAWEAEVWTMRQKLMATLHSKAYGMLEGWRMKLLKVRHVFAFGA